MNAKIIIIIIIIKKYMEGFKHTHIYIRSSKKSNK